MNNNSYTLLDLLPYKSDIEIFDITLFERIKKISLCLLEELTQTIKDFYQHQNTLAFDPHVGENLCQIRAVYLLDIMQKNSDISTDKFIEKIAILYHDILNVQFSVDKIGKNINELFGELYNKLSINTELYTVFLMHFLTTYRECNNFENTIINYRKMLVCLDISKNLARRFVHEYQKSLSSISCHYILEIANNDTTLNKLLKLFLYQDEDARTVLPCYLVMSILLKRLSSLKKPILFIIRQQNPIQFHTLYYKYDAQYENYNLVNQPTDVELSQHCLIIHGVSNSQEEIAANFKARFEFVGMLNIIMGNMAVHPQYSGKKLLALKQNPFTPLNACSDSTIAQYTGQLESEFFEHKALGLEVGCSEKNPEILFIRHIFADTAISQFKFALNKQFYTEQIQQFSEIV